ncbi:hypothetical protein DXG03_001371, partial [Asterophora parasitica]
MDPSTSFPTHAVFSGLTLSLEDFKAFVISFRPILANYPNMSLNGHLPQYDWIRRRLRENSPKLRVLYDPGDVHCSQNAKGVIFLVRWVPFEDDSQLDPSCEEHRALWTAKETDRVQFDDFRSYFELQTGGKLPAPDRFGFSCVKDIHPALDDRDASAFPVTRTLRTPAPFQASNYDKTDQADIAHEENPKRKIQMSLKIEEFEPLTAKKMYRLVKIAWKRACVARFHEDFDLHIHPVTVAPSTTFFDYVITPAGAVLSQDSDDIISAGTHLAVCLKGKHLIWVSANCIWSLMFQYLLDGTLIDESSGDFQLVPDGTFEEDENDNFRDNPSYVRCDSERFYDLMNTVAEEADAARLQRLKVASNAITIDRDLVTLFRTNQLSVDVGD